MKIFCPRVIRGNRGDLASRLGILLLLEKSGYSDVMVACLDKEDIYPCRFKTVPYGILHNLVPSPAGMKALLFCDVIIWTGGLDLQDDSSLVKLIHTLLVFASYKLLGKKVYVMNQGAGPIESRSGRILTRIILHLTDRFIVRDSRSLKLLRSISAGAKLLQGRDGIFTSAFEKLINGKPKSIQACSGFLIGFNIRMWHHFSSGILPFQYNRRAYEKRGAERMSKLVEASVVFCNSITQNHNVRILLFSMYQAGEDPWENEERYLREIKSKTGEEIELVDLTVGMEDFCQKIRECKCMIGMRLHSALLALRFGVPAITIGYTLKNRDIFRDLGLENWVVDLERFENHPLEMVSKVEMVMKSEQKLSSVRDAISINDRCLKKFSDHYLV
ncbi:MAG: polysaccharide pyruvyl transferase family protein [Chitinispirillaceae bacterium]